MLPIMKNLIVIVSLLAALVAPRAALAQEETCVGVYGGGVVCGVKTHEPVDTALGDINPGILGAGLLVASYILFKLSKEKAPSNA